MTATIPKNMMFAGVPFIRARNVVRRLSREMALNADYIGDGIRPEGPQTIGSRRNVELCAHQALAVLAEATDIGLFEFKNTEVKTASGEPKGSEWLVSMGDEARSFINASMAPRISPEKAAALLDDLLKGAEDVRDLETLPYEVSEIWLFGSYATGDRADFGDIDIAFEVRVKADRDSDCQTSVRRSLMEDPDYPMPESWMQSYWTRLDAVRKYAEWRMFRGRRNPAIADIHLAEMISMHVPCRCVWDSSRGGRVNDPLLTHHPKSERWDPSWPDKVDFKYSATPNSVQRKPVPSQFLGWGDAGFGYCASYKRGIVVDILSDQASRRDCEAYDSGYEHRMVSSRSEARKFGLDCISEDIDGSSVSAVASLEKRSSWREPQETDGGLSIVSVFKRRIEQISELEYVIGCDMTHLGAGQEADVEDKYAEMDTHAASIALLLAADAYRLLTSVPQVSVEIALSGNDYICREIDYLVELACDGFEDRIKCTGAWEDEFSSANFQFSDDIPQLGFNPQK